MQVLYEHQVNADIGVLDKAWSASQTFAFVPDKGGIPDGWIVESLEKLPERLRTGHFALLTSASTGIPKMIIGNRSRAENLTKVLHEIQESDEVEQTIVALPLSYCYAFVNQWLWARQFDRKLVLTRGLSEPDRLREAFKRAENAMLCMVGSQVTLFKHLFPYDKFPGVSRLHFAGGRFPQDLLDDIRKSFPNALIFNNYGCAEAMPRLSIRRAEDSDTSDNIGRPIQGVEMKSGAGGELLFRSPYGAVAYIDDSGFHEVAPGEWIPTGDLGRPYGDGSWQLIGRTGEVFKRYGEKVSLPRLLDTVKNKWNGEAYFYRETDSSGEQGCVLVLAPVPTEAEVRAILKAFRENYERPHWPLRIESIGSMPFLSSGKIDTLALASLNGKTIHWRQRT